MFSRVQKYLVDDEKTWEESLVKLVDFIGDVKKARTEVLKIDDIRENSEGQNDPTNAKERAERERKREEKQDEINRGIFSSPEQLRQMRSQWKETQQKLEKQLQKSKEEDIKDETMRERIEMLDVASGTAITRQEITVLKTHIQALTVEDHQQEQLNELMQEMKTFADEEHDRKINAAVDENTRIIVKQYEGKLREELQKMQDKVPSEEELSRRIDQGAISEPIPSDSKEETKQKALVRLLQAKLERKEHEVQVITEEKKSSDSKIKRMEDRLKLLQEEKKILLEETRSKSISSIKDPELSESQTTSVIGTPESSAPASPRSLSPVRGVNATANPIGVSTDVKKYVTVIKLLKQRYKMLKTQSQQKIDQLQKSIAEMKTIGSNQPSNAPTPPNANATKVIKLLKDRYKLLKAQSQKTIEALKKKLQEAESSMLDHQQMAKAKLDLAESQEAREQLEEEKEELKDTVEHLQQRAKLLEDMVRKQDKGSKFATLEENLASLKLSLADKESTIEELKEQLEAYSDEIRDLRDESKLVKKLKVRLKQEVLRTHGLKKEVAKLNEQVIAHEGLRKLGLKELEKSLAEERSKNALLQSQLDELREELNYR